MGALHQLNIQKTTDCPIFDALAKKVVLQYLLFDFMIIWKNAPKAAH